MSDSSATVTSGEPKLYAYFNEGKSWLEARRACQALQLSKDIRGELLSAECVLPVDWFGGGKRPCNSLKLPSYVCDDGAPHRTVQLCPCVCPHSCPPGTEHAAQCLWGVYILRHALVMLQCTVVTFVCTYVS